MESSVFVVFSLLLFKGFVNASVLQNIASNTDHAGDRRDVTIPVRLVGSPNDGEGRVEVFHDGVWGTVCDVLFGVTEAKLVCNMLGYSYGGLVQPQLTYGFGRGPIMVDLDCPWNATELVQCSHTGWSQTPPAVCNHDADVGVACRSTPAEDVPVRLIGGTGPHEGRVQVWHDGQWGTVCNKDWDPRDAAVICRQLGYRHGGEAMMWPARYSFGARPSGPIWLSELSCGGKEPRLGECPGLVWGEDAHQCQTTFMDASVRCYTENIADFQIRLVGGENNRTGRVTIHHGGRWYDVCDDWWGDDDATAVCRTLGFRKGNATYMQFNTGRLNGIGWDMVYCGSGVTDFRHCFHRGWGRHTCYYYEVAGVICE